MSDVFIRILNLSLTASWLILAVLLVRFIFRKAPRGILCLLWLIVAVRLVIPFDLESALSLIPESEPIIEEMILNEKPSVPHNDSPELVPDIPTYIPDDSPVYQHNTPIIGDTPAYSPSVPDSIPQAPDIAPPGSQTEPADPVTALDIVAITWLAGVAVMVLYCAISYIRVWRRVADSIPGEGNVRISERIATPFILGVIRPKIYLPTGVTGATAEYVTAHERSHLKRMDHLIKPIGFLILSVYWFNPLVWIAYILLCRDIELACDERVLGKMDEEGRRAYAAALLECGAERKIISACPLAFGEVGVKDRIMNALNYKKPMLWVIVALVLATCVVIVCFLTNPISADETKESETETTVETESESESESETEKMTESESATETEKVTETETKMESDTETEDQDTTPETESVPAVTPEQPPVDTTAPSADTEPVTPAKPTTTTKPSGSTVTKPEKNYVTAENIKITNKGHFGVNLNSGFRDELADIACDSPTKERWNAPYTILLESVADAKKLFEHGGFDGVAEYGEDFYKDNSLIVIYKYWVNIEDYVEFGEASFDGKTFRASIVDTDYVYRGLGIEMPAIQEDLWILEINGKFANDVKFEGETVYNPIYMDPNAHATQEVVKNVSYTAKYYKDVAVDFDYSDTDLRQLSCQNVSENAEVYVIETPKAADIFAEKTKSKSNSSKTSLGSIVSQYSDEYFKDKSLIIILQDVDCVGWDIRCYDLSYYYGVAGEITTIKTPGATGKAGTHVCVVEVMGRFDEWHSIQIDSCFVDDLYYNTNRRPVSEDDFEFMYSRDTISWISEEAYTNMAAFEVDGNVSTEIYSPSVYLIESFSELNMFVEQTSDSNGSPFEGLLDKFTKNYFDKKSLALILVKTPNSGGRLDIDNVFYDEDTFRVDITETFGGALTALCNHLIIGEINGVFSQDISTSINFTPDVQ